MTYGKVGPARFSSHDGDGIGMGEEGIRVDVFARLSCSLHGHFAALKKEAHYVSYEGEKKKIEDALWLGILTCACCTPAPGESLRNSIRALTN